MAVNFDDLIAKARGHSETPGEKLPYVALDGFEFILIDVELCRRWVQVVDTANPGQMKYQQSDVYDRNEDGTACQTLLKLAFVDPRGRQTSLNAPFKYRSMMPNEEISELIDKCGEKIKLVNPRIVFKDVKPKNGYGLESRPEFRFDGFEK